jgi:hypothetical protein
VLLDQGQGPVGALHRAQHVEELGVSALVDEAPHSPRIRRIDLDWACTPWCKRRSALDGLAEHDIEHLGAHSEVEPGLELR